MKRPKLGKWAKYNYLARYGLTETDYWCMYERQQGRCLLCEQERRLVVDHSHVTGKVRGLLCHRCNGMLSIALEDPTWFKRAVAYLKH